jgi:hypothetical protein
VTDPIQPEPITVQPHAAPLVMSESTKMVLMAAFAVAAAHFIQSESVMGVVLAASGVVVTWGYSVYRRLANWSVMKNLTTFVDDSVARIGKPK